MRRLFAELRLRSALGRGETFERVVRARLVEREHAADVRGGCVARREGRQAEALLDRREDGRVVEGSALALLRRGRAVDRAGGDPWGDQNGRHTHAEAFEVEAEVADAVVGRHGVRGRRAGRSSRAGLPS